MKKFVKSERFIYAVIAVAFLGAFLAVYLKTEQKLETLREAEPVVIHDINTEKTDTQQRTVYITPSGKKYHLDGCEHLSGKEIAVSLEDALNAQYEPCAYCQP